VIEHRNRLLRTTWWLALLLASFAAAAAPRIGLVTMDPGETYWERFGHNAILVAPEDGSEPLLYNYGYFDFDEPGFLLRFARGDMRYRLVEIPLADDLAYYRDAGRGVDLLWLDVAPDKALRLAEFLRWNARPENAGYRYDYFTDNCATRVRDALDDALDGALQRQLNGRSHGLTYRDEALRLGAPVAWMALGMHIGMGPFGDRPLSLWQEAFVPMRLRDDLREVLTTEGHPVIVAEQTLNVARLPPEPPESPRWRTAFLATGLALAAAFAGLRRWRARIAAGLALAWWSLLALSGLGLAALWGLTSHVAAFGNENLLLFNPLCLLLLPGAFALARGREPGRGFRRALMLIATLAGIAVFLKLLPFRVQSNGDWIALVLPLQALLALSYRQRPGA
jgi:hypothetical protein